MFYRAITTILPIVLMLPAGAVAQTVLESSSTPYVLNDEVSNGSFSVDAGALIQIPMGHAISGSVEDWSLVNLGSIESLEFGNAIEIQGGSLQITNGSAETAGDIRAFHNGINVNGDLTVFNLGDSTIHGGDHGIIVDAGSMTLVNEGTITGFNADSGQSSGVYVLGGGGTITNREGATIEGMQWGAAYGFTLGEQGNIENYGTLAASLGYGANSDRGTINNYTTGLITGGMGGVQLATGRFTNAGTVIANGYYENGVLQQGNGVRINGEGAIFNKAGGKISGVGNGVAIDWIATVTNAGTIEAIGTKGNGIQFAEGGEGKIINSGSIIGGVDGYAIHSLSGYNSELVLLPGSSISGLVQMGGGDGDRLTLGGTRAASVSGLEQYRNFEVGTVENGAIWTLDGALDIGEFTNHGTLQAGTGDTTLAITGKFVQTDTGTLQVVGAANGGNSMLEATEAEIAGMVHVEAGSGQWRQGTYTILEADMLSGQFSGSTTDLAFLTPTLGGDLTSVTLTLTRNGVALGDVAVTDMQSAVANALAAGSRTALVEALEARTAEDARAAFDALVGDIHAYAGGQSFVQAAQMRGVVMGRALAPHGGSEGDAVVEPAAYVGLPVTAAGAAAFGLAAAQPVAPQIEWWSEAYGGTGSVGANGDLSASNWVNGGFVAGLDVSDDAWRVGLGGGLGKGVVDNGDGTAAVDSYTALVYASHRAGLLALRGGASFGLNSISTERQVVFPGFSERLNASYGGSTAQVFGEVGIQLPVGESVSIEPYVGLAYGHFTSDGAQETGGAAALNIAAADLALLTATVGVRASATLSLSEAVDLTPRLGLAWQRNQGDAPSSTIAFSPGADFTVTGDDVASDVLLVDMGFDLSLPEGFGLSFDYGGALTDAGASHQFKVGMGKAL